jgi:hypothetical protein
MDGGTLHQTARTIGTIPTAARAMPRPQRSMHTISAGLWPVILFSAIGLAIAFGLSHGALCTGVDINAGCVPAASTAQPAP